MKRILTSIFLAAIVAVAAPVTGNTGSKPKLVVAIIIDQFRYDYLTRFRSEYHGGLDELMRQGADFTNAFYAQVPTVTAVGHSIFLSGAMPSVSGIIANEWYDRRDERVVTSVCDWSVHTIGAPESGKKSGCTDEDPASPKRLLVSTLGDELRDASPQSKVIGISIKARAAILPSGHRANGAFWFDPASGNFVSSSFYMDSLPEWARRFNDEKLAAEYVHKSWPGFPQWHVESHGSLPYANLAASPWGNELIEKFAEHAIEGEKLGQRGVTDLLTISFSSNDYVGHRVGPDAPEVRDMAIRTDRLLARLFQFIERNTGMTNTLVVLSADHGVAPTPAQDAAVKMPGGYIAENPAEVVEKALDQRFGQAKWLLPGNPEMLYLNRSAIENVHSAGGRTVTYNEIFQVARQALFADPQLHVARVYTSRQLDDGVAGDFIARAEMNGYFPARSGDIFIVFDPYYVFGHSGTSHFSPYAYDRHVPILFMGHGIKPGKYNETITPNDIAPTLAAMLSVQTPSGSSGRVLTEMLTQ
jgi:predicted AlkP superfamily pyrophosphatase or phosphodiesterase